MKIAVIDNFDSFVYNIVRYIRECTVDEVIVQRNNQIEYEVLEQCDAILLSPGPGIPSEAGDLISLIKRFSGKKKILGVCLGHQAIAEAFGGSLEQCLEPFHGRSSMVRQTKSDSLFYQVPVDFEVGRYHSWRVFAEVPPELEVIVQSSEQEIMAMRHISHPTKGVQFHPESILTPYGRKIIENWIKND
jgi:anthranilate synthase component II